MKLLLVILSIFISGIAYSSPPYDMCQYERICSQPQAKIYKEFQSCAGYNPELNKGRVYSGSCYHLSRFYKNDHEHYGAMYFNLVDDEPRFGGSFSFYPKTNPYKKLTNEQAANKYSSSINKKNHTLDISSGTYGHIFWDGELPENTIEYWFKTCGDKVYMQGAWGPQHQFICKLEPNE